MKMGEPEGLIRFFLEPGEHYYSSYPAVVQTILGSCIAVTIHSPRLCSGAICHAMLPDSSSGRPGEHVEEAISIILKKMIDHGAKKGELVVKLFGGSNVLSMAIKNGNRPPSIGEQNIEQALKTLHKLELEISARDTGGDTGRKLFFHTSSGDVFVRRQRSSPAKRSATI